MQYEPSLPTTWEELLALRTFLDSCPGSYLRHPEDQNFYELYQQLIPKDIFLEIIRRQIEPQKKRILLNRFPYSRVLQNLPNVSQYVFWSLAGPLSDIEVEHEVDRRFPKYEWFAVESAPHRKSVPEIWHTHIFLNEKLRYSR